MEQYTYRKNLMNSITAVTDPANPKILEAYGSAGDQLNFDSVYHANHITAQVPHYTGMARGQTVRMTWENPRHIYHSEVVTVGTPGAIDIPIPRIEVIDAIGHTVKVYYTVRTAPGTAPIPSRTLLLHIDPYEFDLLAPTLSTDQITLSVRYVGMVRGYTVRIRATGKTTWESDEREVQTGVTPTFTLPSNWIAENRGIDTRINYSVYKSGSGQRFMFSKVLRARIGEHVLPAPIIATVKDPNNVTVPNGGSTVETTVTLTGTASKGQKVEIQDGGVRKDEAIADPVTGIWSKTITGLSVAAHSFTAKALYGAGASSAARTLTVTAVVAPTISSVKGSPSNVEIPQGGTTVETAVTLTGTASKGQKVQVLEGTTPRGEPIANPTTGVWSQLVTPLTAGSHSFTAKALYGSGAVSAARTFTIANVEDFESSPYQQITAVGQTILTRAFKIMLLTSHGANYLNNVYTSIPGPRVNGRTIYNYLQFNESTMSYSFELISGTTNRIKFWITGGNVTTKTPRMDVSFLGPSGQVLRTLTLTSSTSFRPESQVDSGSLINIKSIKFTPNTQFFLDHFEIE
jgi:hypothetical protein